MATATKSKKKSTTAVRPLHDKIIVRRDEAQSQTESGIFLPESSKDRPKTGVIEAVGDGKLNTDTGERIPLTVTQGDRVIFSSYAGTEIKLDGDELLIMSEDEILAIID
ncbi:MAG: co-chaperone GroES [Planctomycetota bacterium]|nr:co-chaperone GroES [Planctomycetota bacterium]